MKKIEWVLAGMLISMGLICLTASAATMGGAGSVSGILRTFLEICLWMGLPVLVIGIIYFLFLRKKKNQ